MTTGGNVPVTAPGSGRTTLRLYSCCGPCVIARAAAASAGASWGGAPFFAFLAAFFLRAFDESKPVVPALELASDSSAVLLLPVLVLPPPSRALLVSDTVVVLLPGMSPNRDGPLLTGWFCFWKPGAVRAPESNVGWKSLANWAHAIE